MTTKLFKKLRPENGYVIGEIACGHEGDREKLKILIDCVSKSKCRIIKFQIFKTKERAIKGHKEWAIFSKLELTEDVWSFYIDYAKKSGLHVLADVYGSESLDMAERLGVDGYKIHSEDLLNSDFILNVCDTNKIIIIGIGGAKRIEINDIVKHLHKNSVNKKIILMTGVQTFPTPMEAHSIKEIQDLKVKYSKYGIKVGFSDHVSGDKEESFILPIMAFSNGASVVEKHLTYKREYKWIDYHSALSADKFNKFVRQVQELCLLLKPIGKMNSYEKSYRKMFKKSPSFRDNLTDGHVLDSGDIVYIKDTDSSIPVSSIGIIGKKIDKSVNKQQLIRSSCIKSKIGAIIVARCDSSRLPNKALMKINGRESIAIVINRIKKCKEVGQIVLATTHEKADDILVDIAKREGVLYYRGPTDNVALRYYEAAVAFEFDHFVRITGDAILCDEKMIDNAINSHLYNSTDVTFMRNMPFGTHKEVVSLNTLKTIIENATIPDNTEYLEYYLENDRYFNINYVYSKYKFNPKIRMTLDYREDFNFFSAIFKHFKEDFSLEDVLRWLDKNKDMVELNAHMMQKTPANLKLDVSLKI